MLTGHSTYLPQMKIVYIYIYILLFTVYGPTAPPRMRWPEASKTEREVTTRTYCSPSLCACLYSRLHIYIYYLNFFAALTDQGHKHTVFCICNNKNNGIHQNLCRFLHNGFCDYVSLNQNTEQRNH